MTAAAALRKIVTPEVRERMDRALCVSIRALIPHRINRITVSEWAEAHRILPSSVTPMPGPFRFDLVPQMREIADCFSEELARPEGRGDERRPGRLHDCGARERRGLHHRACPGADDVRQCRQRRGRGFDGAAA